MHSGLVLSLVGLLAACASAADPVPPPRLAAPVELMKLPKDQVPVITFADPFVRVSPKGDRCIYIRRTGSDAKTMLHIRTFGPPAQEHPVLTAVPVYSGYWRWGFSGRCWRADGLQVAYLLAGSKDGMENDDVRHRLGVAYFDWSLPLPQQSGGGIAKDSPRTHTAVSYEASGTRLWRAESDLRNYASCRVVGPKGALYEGKGFAIHDLAPSPDGKHVAWLEVPQWKRRPRPAGPAAAREQAARQQGPGQAPPARQDPSIVVLEVQTRRIVHRLALPLGSIGPPLWLADGTILCYGCVVEMDRLFRPEIRALKLADGSTQLIARDAKAVGALGTILLANRGPACVPMTQHSSSYAPPPGTDPRPKRNEIVLLHGDKEAAAVVLLGDAFAQEVVGRSLIYAEENGPDVIVWRAAFE